jgi:peptidoglycan/LPS O-acetylase OafA/YrhL
MLEYSEAMGPAPCWNDRWSRQSERRLGPAASALMFEIQEPGTTITDLMLSVECVILAILALRTSHPLRWKAWACVFFLATAAAALAGALSHGWLNDDATLAARVAWRSTLIALGLAGLGAWGLGSLGINDNVISRRVRSGASLALLGYIAAVLAGNDAFVVAIAFYLPSAIFLMAVLAAHHRRPGAKVGIAGLALMFIGAGLQQAGVALAPPHLDHNVLYHLIQMVALPLLFIGLPALEPR